MPVEQIDGWDFVDRVALLHQLGEIEPLRLGEQSNHTLTQLEFAIEKAINDHLRLSKRLKYSDMREAIYQIRRDLIQTLAKRDFELSKTPHRYLAEFIYIPKMVKRWRDREHSRTVGAFTFDIENDPVGNFPDAFMGHMNAEYAAKCKDTGAPLECNPTSFIGIFAESAGFTMKHSTRYGDYEFEWNYARLSRIHYA